MVEYKLLADILKFDTEEKAVKYFRSLPQDIQDTILTIMRDQLVYITAWWEHIFEILNA